MEQLKAMKQTLMSAAQSQMGNLEQVNAKELGEVIDMIKDLEEATYYCSIVKAMEDSKEKQETNEKTEELMSKLIVQNGGNQQQYYTSYNKYPNYLYEPDRMYYGGNGSGPRGGMTSSGMGTGNTGSNGNYYGGDQGYMPPYQYPPMMITRDYREGRSGQSRRGYMEGKEQHKDKASQMAELEKYITELGQDVTEMIRDASPEEKQLLQQKLSTLASKVNV